MKLKDFYPLFELTVKHLIPMLNGSSDPRELLPPEVKESSHRLMVEIIIDTKADSVEEAKSLVTSRLLGIGANEVVIHEVQDQVRTVCTIQSN